MGQDRDTFADAASRGAASFAADQSTGGPGGPPAAGSAPHLIPGSGWPAADTLDGLGHAPFTPPSGDWNSEDGKDDPREATPFLPPRGDRTRVRPIRPAKRRRRRRHDARAARPLRRPVVGLPVIVLMALLGAFFGWVSGDPFWLATGAGTAGTVTVKACDSGALGPRCTGTFVAGDRSVAATTVYVSGLSQEQRTTGAVARARMLDPAGGFAYTSSGVSLHLRWLLGLALAIGCGLAAAVASGVRRLHHETPARLAMAWGLAVGGPVVLFAGMLATAALV